jgi:peptidyl-prolyl cis-trans isomerase SurA
VNNDAITQYELDEAELYYLAETRQRPSDGEERKGLRGQLLQNLIENRIQLQQAEREKVVVEDAELAEAIGDIQKKLKAKDDAEFEAMIKSQGLTLEGVRKRMREQLMVQRVIRRKVALRISVTEQEIDKYLTENREKLETGLTFGARHILVMPDPAKGEEGWTAARLRADEIYGHLLEGRDFVDLAKEYSDDPSGKDGGSLGSLKRGELAQDIEDAILRLTGRRSCRHAPRSARSSTARSTTRGSRTGSWRSSSARSSISVCKIRVDRAGIRVGQWFAKHGSQPPRE